MFRYPCEFHVTYECQDGVFVRVFDCYFDADSYFSQVISVANPISASLSVCGLSGVSSVTIIDYVKE